MSLDVLPADVPAQYAPAMVAACSDALAEGSCALASTLPESTQPQAVALVLWQGEGLLQVTVRVGRGGGQWVARALTFSERDSISDRWTTVGLTVATLVGETRAFEANSGAGEPAAAAPSPVPAAAVPAEPPAPSARPVAPPPPPPPPPAPRSRWLGSVGLLTGPGWDGGGWQRGGWLALTFRVPRLPLQAHASASYALSDGPSVQGDELGSRWMTAALGAGVFGTWRALALVGSAEIELGYRSIDVDFNGKRASDQELPVRLRGLLSFPADGTVAATLGGLLRLPPQNSKKSTGLTLASPAVAVEAVAGLEVRL